MPSIFNNPGSAPTIDYNNSIVETAYDWGDWTYAPQIICRTAKMGLPPDTGRATFNYRSGFLQIEGENTASQFDPLDLVDQYVRVSIQQPYSDPTPVWWGLFSEQTTTSMQVNIASGDQEFTAQGIEYLLDRCPINGAVAIKNANPYYKRSPNLQKVYLNSALSFNRKPTKGKTLVGNRSHNLGPDNVYLFSAYGAKWSNLAIANHLLQYFAPTNVTFQLVGQTDPLDQMVAFHDFKEGTTLWKALTALIQHKKGLIMIPQVGDDGTVYLVVDTVQDTPIQLDGLTLPPNSNPVQFTMPDDPVYSHVVDDVPITKTDKTNYGNILVYGARVKMMFPAAFTTLSSQVGLPNGNLVHGGDVQVNPTTMVPLVNNYMTGVPGGGGNAQQNDQERQKDIYRDIFQRFRVDGGWNGQITLQSSSKAVNVMPIPLPDGTITLYTDVAQQVFPDFTTPQFVLFNHVYYKRLPIKQGIDYSTLDEDGKFVDNNPDGHTAEYVPMLGLYYDQSSGVDPTSQLTSVHTADNKWHKLEKLKADNPSLKPLTLHHTDTELGVHIEGHPNHYLAFNHWDTAPTAGPTQVNPEIDYRNLCIVGAVDLDVRPCCQWQGPQGNNRTKIAVMNSCRYIYATPECPVDVDNNGQLVRITNPATPPEYAWAIFDDDHKVLQQVCAEMASWLGTPRQTIVITIKQPGVYVPLGSFLTQMNTNYSTEPIGTLINSIEIDFDHQTTVIRTGFEELDAVHLLGRPEDVGEEAE
jgi:hypothetical protein